MHGILIGHTGNIIAHHLRFVLAAPDESPVLAGHLLRMLLVIGVEGNQHLLCLLFLFFRVRIAVDVCKHQFPQQAHALGNFRRLTHILRSAALLHNVVNQRIEPLAACIAKDNTDRNRDVILA